MDHSKLLTISIAAYNAEPFLERTLTSLEIEEELFDFLDIIIVDDGSNDGTASIADRFAAKHSGSVRVVRKQNGGYGSTVNTSMAMAKGLYFKLLDADDTFDKAGFEGLVRYLGTVSRRSADEVLPDLVIGPFIYGRYAGSTDDLSGRADADSGAYYSELCDRHTSLQTEVVGLEDSKLDDGLMMFELCVRTDVLRRSGAVLTENCFYTDNEYVMAAELYASTAVRYPFPVYRYRIGTEGQSMSVKSRRQRYDEKIRAAHGVFDIYDHFIRTEGQSVSGTRKLITDKLLSTMVREVYVSLMIQDRPAEYRSILSRFDDELRTEYSYAFEVSQDSRLVSSARKAGALFYPALCRYVLRSEIRRMGGDRIVPITDDAGTVPAEKGSLLLKTAEYTTAACMIIQCRTVYMHLKDYGMIVNRSVWAVMMAALLVCIILSTTNNGDRGPEAVLPGEPDRNMRTWRRILILYACITAYTALFIIVNPVNYLRVIRCSSAVLMMMVLNSTSRGSSCSRRIMSGFRDIMVIIAAVSLLGWISGSIIKFLPCTGYCWIDWSATGEYVRIPTFLGIYFETQWTDWDLVQARNSGIFVEAPMAGCCYSIALLFEYMLTGSSSGIVQRHGTVRKRKIRIMVLAAAVLSTLSLISYGFLILLKAANLVTSRRQGGSAGRRGKAATIIPILAGTLLLTVFVIRKLQLPSGNVRFSDFAVGFHAWFAHPFFGGGFESLEYLQQFMPEWRSFDIGFSNSPMEILGQGGIYLALPYVYAFAASAVRSFRNHDRVMLAAVMLFAYIFTFTVIPYQYITFFILIFMVNRTAAYADPGMQFSE